MKKKYRSEQELRLSRWLQEVSMSLYVPHGTYHLIVAQYTAMDGKSREMMESILDIIKPSFILTNDVQGVRGIGFQDSIVIESHNLEDCVVAYSRKSIRPVVLAYQSGLDNFKNSKANDALLQSGYGYIYARI